MEFADFIGRELLAAVKRHVQQRPEPRQQKQPTEHGRRAGIELRLQLREVVEHRAKHRDLLEQLHILRRQPDEREDQRPQGELAGAEVVEQRDQEIDDHPHVEPAEEAGPVAARRDDGRRDEADGDQQPQEEAGVGGVDGDFVEIAAAAADEHHRQRDHELGELEHRAERGPHELAARLGRRRLEVVLQAGGRLRGLSRRGRHDECPHAAPRAAPSWVASYTFSTCIRQRSGVLGVQP